METKLPKDKARAVMIVLLVVAIPVGLFTGYQSYVLNARLEAIQNEFSTFNQQLDTAIIAVAGDEGLVKTIDWHATSVQQEVAGLRTDIRELTAANKRVGEQLRAIKATFGGGD